jgi:AcrR family transcriptional regulator
MKRLAVEKQPCAALHAACCRRRKKILEKAVQLFAKHGYSATDTQMLVDEVHVGKGTLYRYFPSKEDLFLAAVDHSMQMLHDHVEKAAPPQGDPVDQIRRGVRAYLAFFARHREFAELLIQERALFKDRRKPTYFRRRKEYAKRWQELYRGLIAKGRIRELPPERIAEVVGDLLYGTMFTNFLAGRRQSFETQAAAILDVVLFGVLSDAERANGQRCETAS